MVYLSSIWTRSPAKYSLKAPRNPQVPPGEELSGRGRYLSESDTATNRQHGRPAQRPRRALRRPPEKLKAVAAGERLLVSFRNRSELVAFTRSKELLRNEVDDRLGLLAMKLDGALMC